MDEMKKKEKDNLEYFHKRLLDQFSALRQQQDSTQRQSEEECIELALKRISWGNYRVCMKCGGEIGENCLMADPTVTICEICTALPGN